MAQFRILIVPLLLVALTGCKLIDQTFFNPDPEPSPAAIAPTIAVPAAPSTALLSIGYQTPNPAFEGPLAVAVRAAEQRRPGGHYAVIGVSTVADAMQTGRDAATIMAEMMRLGVPAARIHLGARIDPAQTVRKVGIHLR
ncbi:MAG: hypothetical protein EXR09_06585 [Acetobacteraceae bacterium]|nr:hypothetical protein [Acetobacteraceae bacterium]